MFHFGESTGDSKDSPHFVKHKMLAKLFISNTHRNGHELPLEVSSIWVSLCPIVRSNKVHPKQPVANVPGRWTPFGPCDLANPSRRTNLSAKLIKVRKRFLWEASTSGIFQGPCEEGKKHPKSVSSLAGHLVGMMSMLKNAPNKWSEASTAATWLLFSPKPQIMGYGIYDTLLVDSDQPTWVEATRL